jgi:hypothetical protein
MLLSQLKQSGNITRRAKPRLGAMLSQSKLALTGTGVPLIRISARILTSTQEKVIELRAARVALKAAIGQVHEAVPDAVGTRIDLMAQRIQGAVPALPQWKADLIANTSAGRQMEAEKALRALRFGDAALLADLRENIHNTLRRQPEVSEAARRATMSAYDAIMHDGQTPEAMDTKALREEVMPWLIELRKECTAYVDETIGQAHAEWVSSVEETNAHTDSAPWLLGKARWRRENEAMLAQVVRHERRFKALEANDWTQEKTSPREAAMQRVQRKLPELAVRAIAVLGKIATQLVNYVQREHAREQIEHEQLRQRDRARERDSGPSRSRPGPRR